MRLRAHPVAGALALAVVGFLWVPILAVAVNSINQNSLMISWGGATAHWYTRALHDPNVRTGLITTIEIALGSTLLSLVIAVSGALWWRRASARARAVYDGTVYARIILPEVVFATALFFLFLKMHFPLGIAAITIGHSVWNSAYAAVIIQARLVGLDPAIEEAAADLGATPWRAFRRVTFAALLPAIIAGGLLTFTFSFDDVVTSYFLGGNSATPLPLVLFGMIRFRITPEINAIGVMVMLFTVTLMGVAVAVFALMGSAGRGRRAALAEFYGR
jgi:ABC-type spermidine/putrescine transport system permease subunit II